MQPDRVWLDDTSWWLNEAAHTLVANVAGQPVVKAAELWKIRVDQLNPRRREKIGDFITVVDGRIALAARTLWAGWTPGCQVVVTLADGTVVTGPWVERLVCCESHNRNCEPPSELCCEYCSEVWHPKHVIIPCVLAPPASMDRLVGAGGSDG